MTSWDTPGSRFRRRVRIRGPLTLLVLMAFLGVVAWYGYNTVLDVEKPKPVRVCNTPGIDGEQRISSKTVMVNIYNAGKTRGLAEETASELEERGFQIGDVTNAPEGTEVPKETVQIRGRAKDAPEVQLVRKHVTNAAVKADGRKTYDVDLFLGTKFDGLLKKAPTTVQVTSKLAACRTATPTPTP